ncbi:MAG TPA: sigma factor [Cyclobacteriaceae bacterium]|nr:sigma factor [Cyclobacteriaceae bacterium]
MEANFLQPEKWVTRYGDYLFSLAMVKTGDRETAQDLVQETLLSAVKYKKLKFSLDQAENCVK